MTDLLPTADNPARVIVGDSLDVLRRLPDGCVHCCVTSPPYWSLRDYAGCSCVVERVADPACGRCGGTGKLADVAASQIGLEPTPAAFVARLVEVFEEVKRVLHPSGVLFVNVGDSYAAGGMGQGSGKQLTNRGTSTGGHMDKPRKAPAGLKPKDLCGVPWRLAFALQEAGWWLRSDIPWVKRSSMPESVTDRPAKALEYVFLLSKSPNYFFDMESVRQAVAPDPRDKRWGTTETGSRHDHADDEGRGMMQPRKEGYVRMSNPAGRSLRNADLWFQSVEGPHGFVGVGDELVGLDVTSQSYAEAHFATFPPALVEPMVKAGSSERGVCPECGNPWRRVTERTTIRRYRPNAHVKYKDNRETTNGQPDQTKAGVSVSTLGWEPTCKHGHEPVPSLILDPFAGSGTTLAVAVKLKRRALGIELNAEYAALCEKRLAEPLGVGGLFAPSEPVVRPLFDDMEGE